MMKSFTKRTAQLFLAFVCSFLLFGLLSLICIRMTLMRPAFMQQQATHSQYASNVQKEMNEKIQDLARGSNISPEVVKNVISHALVEKNVNQYIRTVYSEQSFHFQGEGEIKKILYQKVNQYAKDKKIQVNEQTNKDIDQFVNSSIQTIKQSIEIPYLAAFVKKVSHYQSKLNMFIVGAGVAFCVLVLMLFATLRLKDERISFSSMILAGTGLSMVVGPLGIYLSGWIDRIGIMTKSIYEFVRTYLTAFDLIFVETGVVLIVLTVLLLIVYGAWRRKKERAKC